MKSNNLDDYELSSRTNNFLKNESIYTVQQLSELTEAEILRTPNVGKVTLSELRDVLDVNHLTFKPSELATTKGLLEEINTKLDRILFFVQR